MTKRVFVLRIVACLAVLICLLCAYYAGYENGASRRLDGVIAWSGPWLWYDETAEGTAYVLDAGNGCDGTVYIDFGDDVWTPIPLYVW